MVDEPSGLVVEGFASQDIKNLAEELDISLSKSFILASAKIKNEGVKYIVDESTDTIKVVPKGFNSKYKSYKTFEKALNRNEPTYLRYIIITLIVLSSIALFGYILY